MFESPCQFRVDALQKLFVKRGLGAVAFLDIEGFNWENVYYLSGFRGTSAAFVVTADDAFLMTDSRYLSQAREQNPFTVIDQGMTPMIPALIEELRRRGVSSLGLEGDRLFHRHYEIFREANFALTDISGLMPAIRRRKDPLEKEIIREAGELAGKAFVMTLEKAGVGMQEQAFAALLEYNLRSVGAEGGWGDHDFIVASGPRSALPHGRPTGRSFGRGEWVTVDFGARYKGYVSDITRNFSLGRSDPWARDMHDLLLKAHRRAADGLAPGVECRVADALARDVIEAAGAGALFGHGLGHGLGLEVHEIPHLSARSSEILRHGDVVTVEPGVYLEGKGGLRLEDDYYVTADGAERLTSGLAQDFFEL